jgi:hypothetical protein
VHTEQKIPPARFMWIAGSCGAQALFALSKKSFRFFPPNRGRGKVHLTEQTIEMKEHDMTKRMSLAALGAGAFSLFALALAHASEAPTHKHTTKAARHVSTRTARHSYARMPTEDEVTPSPSMSSSPNLFETGRPPAQPGQAH